MSWNVGKELGILECRGSESFERVGVDREVDMGGRA